MHYATGLPVATGALVLINGDDAVPAVGLCACTGALVLTNVPVPLDPPVPEPVPVAFTGALVLINGDDAVPAVGLCACTGALVLTNVPVPLDPPVLEPVLVAFTGALVLTNGDLDEVFPPPAVEPDPPPVPPVGVGPVDGDGAAWVPLASRHVGLVWVPVVVRTAGDAETLLGQAPAKAGVVEDNNVIPAPASPRRDAARPWDGRVS